MKGNSPVATDESQNTIIPKDFLSSFSVRSPDFAIQYLENTDIIKPQFNRLISWLFKFNLLSSDCQKWDLQLNKLRKDYIQGIKNSSLDTATIESIDADLPPIIPRDLNRSIQLFEKFVNCLELDFEYFDNSTLRIHRIFYFLQKNDDKFSYLQGYDRFIYLSLCVSLSFCMRLHIDSDSIEAFGYYLSKSFINSISIADSVLDPDESLLIMSDLSDFLKLASPATASAFISQSISCQMYAMNYLLLLFEDQHNPFEILILWDLIILHCDNDQEKMKFIYSLTVAHLVQIPIGLNTSDTIQRIAQSKEFNFKRLVDDANRFYSDKHVYEGPVEKSGGIPPGVVLIIAVVVLASAGVLLYKLMKD